MNKYDKVFKGVGKLKHYQLRLHLNHINLVVQAPPSISCSQTCGEKLKELQDLDIIEDVEGITPWVSPLVAVPKSNGNVGVCFDMRRANTLSPQD